MKLLRLLLILIVLLTLVVTALLWWNRPGRVDMAAYAPADSLVYLEFNSLTDLAKAIEQNEMWKAVAPMIGSDPKLVNTWSTNIARAGLAPVQSVVLSRAQFALVVVGLNSVEEEDTLRIRPEIALIVETHTSNWRLQSLAVGSVKQLANYAYGQSSCTENSSFGAHYVECSSTANDRKLIGAIDGSVVIVGNAAKAVQSCLEVRRGMRASLQPDADLQRLRQTLQSDSALSFGYISSANVAKIFSWATPLLIGQAPGGGQLQELLATSAAKILRAIAWTSKASQTGFEDRYVITFEPDVMSRLEPAFKVVPTAEGIWRFVPQDVQSLTIYDQTDPLTAFTSFNSVVAYRLDAVSAVMFSSLLRTSLAVYGIENPSEVLPNLAPPLVTMRSRGDDTSAVLIAQVPYPSRLRQSLQNQFKGSPIQIMESRQDKLDVNREYVALLLDGYVLMGKTDSVRIWLEVNSSQKRWSSMSGQLRELRSGGNIAITTYSNDQARVNSFISTLAELRGMPLSAKQADDLRTSTEYAFFSITETSLNSTGIERRTRSAFGQLSTLLSLVKADSSAASRP